MLKKNYSKTGKACRVTFKLPADISANEVFLCGDFNNWDQTKHRMKKLKDGSFSITISLQPENSFRFRYLLDGKNWENDWEADGYVPNSFSGDDSVINI